MGDVAHGYDLQIMVSFYNFVILKFNSTPLYY